MIEYQPHCPFIIVRYAAGSAGRFISTLIQCSSDVAHWNPDLNNSSTNITSYKSYLDYSFPADPEQHLRVEPDIPYTSDFYSGTYDRGADITLEQYVRYQKDNYFLTNIAEKQYANLILHKSKVPVFMQRSPIIKVILDTPDAIEFAKKMRWLKHYKVINDHAVNRLPADPNKCNLKRADVVINYY